MSVASNLVTPEVATAQNITNLIEAIKPGIEKSQGQPGDKLGNTCKPNILVQIENLKSWDHPKCVSLFFY